MGNLPGYLYRVIVTVHLREPRPSGFPSDAEDDDLEAFEFNVCGLLEAENKSLCVLVVTGQGLRDIIFYTKEPEAVRKKVEDARIVLTSHKFEIDIELEPDWRVYNFFCEKLSTPIPPETKTSASA
jgi:hypothetical protein